MKIQSWQLSNGDTWTITVLLTKKKVAGNDGAGASDNPCAVELAHRVRIRAAKPAIRQRKNMGRRAARAPQRQRGHEDPRRHVRLSPVAAARHCAEHENAGGRARAQDREGCDGGGVPEAGKRRVHRVIVFVLLPGDGRVDSISSAFLVHFYCKCTFLVSVQW